MSVKKNINKKFSELRKKAEQELLSKNKSVEKESAKEIEHELTVYKVELEMQNEELRSTQLKLEKSIENFSELFEFAPVGYFILTIDGTIEKVNDTGSYLLGSHKNLLIERPFSNFISTEFYQDNFYRHRNEVVATEKPQQLECKMKRGNQLVFPALITSTYVKDEYNNFKHFLCTVSDITERKAQEQKVKMALAKEKELNELKSRFISTASHEFRTPLATILLSAELLEKYSASGNEENRKKHLSKIMTSVQGLKEILIDFLSLEKFEDGYQKNCPEKFNLVPFTEQCIEEINIKKHPVTYHHSGKQKIVTLDHRLLKICLSNLIGNAIKYSVNDLPVTVDSTIDAAKNITITVKDGGIGIPENDKPFIFDQFFRAKNAETIQGTGLGLNIVHKFVTIMNGTISFTSKENRGSAFILTFPQQ